MFLKKAILIIGLTLIAATLFAGAKDPLFINMTSQDPHRALMAVSFGMNQLKLGHPLTIYFNDMGVHVCTKSRSGKYPEQQKIIGDILKAGGKVIICPMCLKHCGYTKTDLLPGAVVGNPELTGEALFQDNTKTLSW